MSSECIFSRLDDYAGVEKRAAEGPEEGGEFAGLLGEVEGVSIPFFFCFCFFFFFFFFLRSSWVVVVVGRGWVGGMCTGRRS